MRSLIVRIVALYSLLLLPACVEPSLSSSPLPPSDPFLYPKTIQSGDVLEISYYRTNRLETSTYRIGVGDVLRVEIANHPDLTHNNLTVLPDGRISLSLVGSVMVAGKTVDQVAKEVASEYSSRGIRDPKAAVSIQVPDHRLESFMKAILRADIGNKITLKVFEGQNLALPFLPSITVVDRSLSELRREIREGYAQVFGERLQVTVNLRDRPDQIVYVIGEVRRPSAIKLTVPSNAFIAVAAAGGLNDTADPRYILVVRFKEDGSYNHWFLNFEEGAKSPHYSGYRLTLKGNDVIYASKTPIARVNQFIDQYIRQVIPIQSGVGITFPVGSQ